MTMTALANIESEEPLKTPITFIVKGAALATVRHADPRTFSAYAAKAERPGMAPITSGESVMFGLVEGLIDRSADALERIGDEVDTISREVFRDKSKSPSKKTSNLQALIEQIGRTGDLL